MATITALGTYLPTSGSDRTRKAGADEDAVTLAVAAGVAALRNTDPAEVDQVVLVTRELPLLEGGNSAAVLAGLGVSAHARVTEVLGGAPATLDVLASAALGTLVIGADVAGAAGAAAAFCGATGVDVTAVDRITRSMPVSTRDTDGHRTDYADPRLLRVSGLGRSLGLMDRSAPIVAAAGLAARDAASVCEGQPPTLPTSGASAPLFALAALVEGGRSGLVAAVEQATISVAMLGAGTVDVVRDERRARSLPEGVLAPGSELPISLAAYDRAFEAKLRLEAARCVSCGTLSYPHRYRCLGCGSEEPTDVVPLPRDAEIYTLATIRVPVPGLVSPYTVTLVELGETGVRVLVKLTGAEPGSVKIGDRGRLVFRLVAIRSGVPDYGYGFLPDETAISKESAA
ncbi:MAG: Zn-ribbon domain-containing OB-fold protein [Acidimicrobiia bacterium]